MKRWQQLLSGYLALCLVLASAAGLSPVLHVWLDHGGGAHAHTHAASGAVNGQAAHAHPHSIPAAPRGVFQKAEAPKLAIRRERPLKIFGLEPVDVYRAVCRALAPADAAESNDKGDTSNPHTHHTLSQLLLSGGVEGAFTLIAPPLPRTDFVFTEAVPSLAFIASEWEAQTASRGPPV